MYVGRCRFRAPAAPAWRMRSRFDSCSSPGIPKKLPVHRQARCPRRLRDHVAAWMPPLSFHGRIHGVSRAGGRARALQPGRRSHAWLWCPLRLRLCLIHTAFFKPGRLPLAAGVQCAVKPTASPTPMPHTPTPAWSSAQRACHFKGLPRMHPWNPGAGAGVASMPRTP